MNTRVCWVVAFVTLTTFSSGCRGMRGFLFGRGARCGLCNSNSGPAAPPMGPATQVPCGPATCAPAAQPPVYQAPAECGCNVFGGNTYGSTSYGSAYGGECNCGNSVSSYGPVVTDPYANVGPYDGQIIDGGIVPGSSVPGTIVPGSVVPGSAVPGVPTQIQPDNFSARKFDSDGNRILWEEPLPSGAKSL